MDSLFGALFGLLMLIACAAVGCEASQVHSLYAPVTEQDHLAASCSIMPSAVLLAPAMPEIDAAFKPKLTWRHGALSTLQGYDRLHDIAG